MCDFCEKIKNARLKSYLYDIDRTYMRKNELNTRPFYDAMDVVEFKVIGEYNYCPMCGEKV